MPRTELPSKDRNDSPNWVEWNDKWMSGVRFHVRSAVVYETVTNGDGTAVQRVDAANEDRMRLALWREQITGWSFADQGIPVPSQNVGGAEIIWTVLDGPDFNALAEATQDLLDEVNTSPTKRTRAKGSSTS
jgi:hypothetical protein